METTKKLLFVVIFFAFFHNCKANVESRSLHGEHSSSSSFESHNKGERRKTYYTDTALNFLRHYGMHYHLFDIFFDANDTIIQTTPQRGEQQGKHHFSLSEDSRNDEEESSSSSSSSETSATAEEGPPSTVVDIAQQYLLRDYDHFENWNVATAKINEKYHNLTFVYKPPAKTLESFQYNNRFRYGPNPNDRFLTIGIQGDVWQKEDVHQVHYVYFIGYENGLVKGKDRLYCQFLDPVTREEGNSEERTTEVEITDKIRDVLDRVTPKNVLRCPIPPSVKNALTNQINHLSLHLFSNSSHYDNQKTFLLEEIKIPRLHELDRRFFTVTVETLIESLEDTLLVEWLIHNILLGVEHFYLFLNTKLPKYDLRNSRIRPFLDANLVTVFYYPYLHTLHFAYVQETAFQAHIKIFGPFNTWTGYIDMDEFFLPAAALLPKNKESYFRPVFPHMLDGFTTNGNEPGVMFDTLEMDCAGPNDIEILENGQFHIKKLTNFDDTKSAVSTHCIHTGFLFEEMKHGHGKMWLLPEKISFLPSPHRYNDYWIVWTNKDNGGLFRHFSNYRYTFGQVIGKKFSLHSIGEDNSLRQFIYDSLECLIGIKRGSIGAAQQGEGAES